MHGVLDLATLGAWEILGTPVEMSKEGKEGVPVRVFYTEDGENDEDGIHKLAFEFHAKRSLTSAGMTQSLELILSKLED